MTRDEARAFIKALIAIRENATDEQALISSAIYPSWKPDIAYLAGNRVLYEGVLYKVLQDHTSQEEWTPTSATSLFAKVLIPDETEIPEWEQPDSTNAYMKGDKVTYNRKTYVSICDNNVWNPTEYGWEEIVSQPSNPSVTE